MTTLAAVIVAVILFVPIALYFATWRNPAQVRLGLAQLNTPVREIATVAPDQVPGFSVMLPRSRSWTHVRTIGLTTDAETVALCVGAAAAGVAATAAPTSNTPIRRWRTAKPLLPHLDELAA